MYGLSLTERMDWAAATRRFASATLRFISSSLGAVGVPEAGLSSLLAGVLAAEDAAGEGEGTAVGGFSGSPEMPFFIAAIFAEISARFWAMSASCDSCMDS